MTMELDKTTTLANLRQLEAEITTRMASMSYGDTPADTDTVVQMSEDKSYIRNLIIELEGGNSSIEDYPMVERRNLMSGNMFLEDLDTPSYCSPSSESYWSM